MRSVFSWSLVLFGFWVALSGKFDLFHLATGAVCAVGVAFFSQRLLLLPPRDGSPPAFPERLIPWLRLLLYIPWLFGQIFISSLQVAWTVFQPKMPIRPQMVRIRCSLPHTIARLTLANSITLTPGTVTIDIEGDEFLIHALTEASLNSLEPKGLLAHVKALFDKPAPAQAGVPPHPAPTGQPRKL